MSIDTIEFWTKALADASKLEDSELARHARVSTDNRHRCTDCFTCACEYVRRQRALHKMLESETARRVHAGGA